MGITTKKLYKDVCVFFKEKGYTILEESYVCATHKMLCVDEFGYKYMVNYNRLKSNRKPRPFDKSNPYCIENINFFIKSKNGECECIETRESYQGVKKDLKFKCFKCDKIFYKKFEIMRRRDYYFCRECGIEIRAKTFLKPLDDVIECINNMNYEILEFPKNYTRSSKIKVKDSLGYIGYTKFRDAQLKKDFEKFHILCNKDNYLYNFQHYCDLHNINLKIITNVSDLNFLCACSCGEKFTTNINSVRAGLYRCQKCSNRMSQYQLLVNEFLDENNIEYIREYRFDNCRRKLPLPFDLYLVAQKKVIEVDGKQHEIPINIFGGEKGFEIRKENDTIKTKYCEDNNIPLLRITYKDINDKTYKEKLNNFINK